MQDKLSAASLAVPTPTPWASGFHAWHPVLLQSLFWTEVILSQPQDIPQRENAREASGVRQAWGGWGQRGTPIRTAQTRPQGPQGPSVPKRHCTQALMSPGTNAQRPVGTSMMRLSAWGVWACLLSHILLLFPSASQDRLRTDLRHEPSGWNGSRSLFWRGWLPPALLYPSVAGALQWGEAHRAPLETQSAAPAPCLRHLLLLTQPRALPLAWHWGCIPWLCPLGLLGPPSHTCPTPSLCTLWQQPICCPTFFLDCALPEGGQGTPALSLPC